MMRTKTTTIIKPKSVIFVLLVASTIGLIACGPNENVLKSNTPTPSGPITDKPSSNDPVEKEVEAMRTADFNFIYVLRRRDDGVLNSEDKTFLRAATALVNRRTLSNDQKALIVGSNNKLPPEILQSMKDRFNFEDFSKPESQITNSKAPVNANMNR